MSDANRWKVIPPPPASVMKSALALESTPHPWWKSAAMPMAPSPMAWWNEGDFPAFGNHFGMDPSTWIAIPLLRKAFEGGPPVRIGSWEGNLVVPGIKLLEAAATALKVRMVRIADRGNGNGAFHLASETTMVAISFGSQGRYADINIVTTDEAIVRSATQLFDRCVQPDDPRKGLVFTLVKSMNGYSITRLGAVGTPLERGNYATEVLQDYDHILADFNTASPCGRLVILAGPPGSGKTYLVRSLLAQALSAAFVLVPSHLVEALGGPDIVPALMGAKSEFNGPIVLIIEDADQCLVQRKDGNMNAISALLNLGDGILGAALDVRILATTNADKIEMDPATRRPGRLCRYTEVKDLPPELATKAMQRLTGKLVDFSEPTSIATVYAQAREMGWKPPPIVPIHPEMRKEIL